MASDTIEPSDGGVEAPALGFDPVALREKYRRERDRRLRPDANRQYVETTGDFRHYVDDPNVEPGFTRAALTDTVDVVVIGGGFGGLMAAACSMGCMAQVRWSSTISSAPGAPTGRWRDCGLTSALARRAELSRPPRVIFAGVKRRAGRPPSTRALNGSTQPTNALALRAAAFRNRERAC